MGGTFIKKTNFKELLMDQFNSIAGKKLNKKYFRL